MISDEWVCSSPLHNPILASQAVSPVELSYAERTNEPAEVVILDADGE